MNMTTQMIKEYPCRELKTKIIHMISSWFWNKQSNPIPVVLFFYYDDDDVNNHNYIEDNNGFLRIMLQLPMFLKHILISG